MKYILLLAYFLVNSASATIDTLNFQKGGCLLYLEQTNSRNPVREKLTKEMLTNAKLQEAYNHHLWLDSRSAEGSMTGHTLMIEDNCRRLKIVN